MLKRIYPCFFVLFFLLVVEGGGLHAQAPMDSLKKALLAAKNDSSRCGTLVRMIEAESDNEVWINYKDQLKKICLEQLKTENLSKEQTKLFKAFYSDVLYYEAYLEESAGNKAAALDLYNQSAALAKEINDANRVGVAKRSLGTYYAGITDYKNAIANYGEAIKWFRISGNKTELANVFGRIGRMHSYLGEDFKALKYLEQSRSLAEELHDKETLSSTLNYLAALFNNQGNIEKSLEFYNRSLALSEESKDSMNMSVLLMNIGGVLSNHGNTEKAFENFERSLKICRSIGYLMGESTALHHLGAACATHDPDKALEYFNQALLLQKKIKFVLGLTTTLNSIGRIYLAQKNYSLALKYYTESYQLTLQTGDKKAMAFSLNDLANAAFMQNNLSLAEKYSTECMAISRELGYPLNISLAAEKLYRINKSNGNYKTAFENYRLYILMRDSVNNETNRKASIRSQIKYEYQKQAAADSVAHAKQTEIKNVELQKQQAEIQAKKNQQYALFGGLGLVMIFSGFLYNRFKITQKQKSIIETQKKEVEEQKALVEEKQREVIDSIRYAQRIQKAHLPGEKYLIKTFERLQSSQPTGNRQ